MNTPIADFVRAYAGGQASRLHMPGHKGVGFLGCEKWDITEISGADALYEAEGIIAESERNASALFGSGRTLFSTEGSSQCIRAMLHLALTGRRADMSQTVLAARNVHRAFVYAAALLDLQVEWLYPEGGGQNLCACRVTAEGLSRKLREMPKPPLAVYITSPDYLGGQADIAALAGVCHAYGTLLLVDNAHGAYLHFLPTPCHPLDQGADVCCDSAHKTLPALTGAAYLHIHKNAPACLRDNAKTAMALFGSTSPSYLTLASLDACNRYLSQEYPLELASCVKRLDRLRENLRKNGWQVEDTDPLRITVRASRKEAGTELADRLRAGGVECEFAEEEYLVLMATPQNTEADFARVLTALGRADASPAPQENLFPAQGERVMSIREAIFAPHETVSISESLGRVCASPTVSCPPAIPIAVSGERIGEAALALFCRYGLSQVDVVKQEYTGE